MKRIVQLEAAAFWLLLGVAGCSPSRTHPSAGTVFRGFYASGFEMETFRPCEVSERWWVIAPGPLLVRYEDASERANQEVFAVVRGDTSSRGRVGHLGQYDRYLTVREAIDVQPSGACPK